MRQGPLEHIAKGRLDEGFRMETVMTDMIYAKARGYEQADIIKYKTRDVAERGLPYHAGSGNRAYSYALDRTGDRAEAFQAFEKERTAQHETEKNFKCK